eukprot:gene5789-9610_t
MSSHEQTNVVNEKISTSVEKPLDAVQIEKILKNMGVENHDELVVEQFLEIIYRYVSNVLNDSVVYQNHAGRSEIDVDDVRIAIQSKQTSELPSIDMLLEIAHQKNSNAIQLVEKPTILLPPRQNLEQNKN